MTTVAFTDEQLRAIDARDGSLLLDAAAGSGKTAVLVERFVRAAREDGVPVDSILAITFTEKAAAELKVRIRRRFLEEGDRERARAAERAWISTIHGFCSRVLRSNALAAGLDPDYRVLDEARASALRREAFEVALEQFMEHDATPQRLELLAAYTPDRLAAMVEAVHARLRTRGHLRPLLPAVARGAGGDAEGSYALLSELLPLYGDRYEEAKRARSRLDFEDLELLTRKLLIERPALRERYRSRFTQVMVDELQDTNRLQSEILDLIGHGKLFAVGDDRQSIYSFRGADVAVFGERRAQAQAQGRAASLTTSFRSCAGVLDVLNGAYSELEGFAGRRLGEAPGARAGAPGDPAVELIVVDSGRGHWRDQAGDEASLGADPFGATMRSVAPWRAAEARLLAQRLAEGIATGELTAGDVAVLVRAGTDLGVYERALSERAIPTHVSSGRGYWSQQQVADVRAHLAALANPQDELALYTTLASSLVGASLDALALLGRRARSLGRDPWWALEAGLSPGGDGSEGLADALPDGDRRRLEAFVSRLARDRAAAPRVGLETLIDRAITEAGYDRAVLAMPDGERRMANLRKLMRLARDYEAESGRDLRGFVDFLDAQDLTTAREGEAPLEHEHLDAVRLMTIHAAKGLEFPVVCVADLGRAGRAEGASLAVTEDGRAGLELLSLGGERTPALDLETIRAEDATRAEAEEKRILYVAMTRAQRRLIVSGATDTDRWPEPRPLGAPMEWVWRALAPRLALDAQRSCTGQTQQPEREGRRARLLYTVCSPATVTRVLPASARAPGASQAGASTTSAALTLPPPAPAPVESPQAIRRVSYSALDAYARCPRCFYVERVLGHGPDIAPIADGDDARAPDTGADLPALERGTVVHELLQRLDLRRPAAPSAAQVAARLERGGRVASGRDVEAIRVLVAGFAESATCARLAAAAGVRRELPFAYAVSADGREDRSVLVTGVVDAHAVERDRTLIVDYKSDRLDGHEPASLAERKYAIQRDVYALAALRAGAPRAEVSHLFLERPAEPVAAVFDAAGADELERRLGGLVEGISGGHFESAARCGACASRGESVRDRG